MRKILIFVIISVLSAGTFMSCADRPQKRSEVKNVIGTDAAVDSEAENVSEAEIETDTSENGEESSEGTETKEWDTQEPVAEQQPEEEIIDTHVYTGAELTDELISEKLEGYWETGEFGYLRGYRFFESGFLQLVLQRKVNQTGIYMVRGGGVYFSLDSKTWDEDVLIVQSISDTEVVGAFGENLLVLQRADENLIEENSGAIIENDDSGYGSVIDAATEVGSNVKVQ